MKRKRERENSLLECIVFVQSRTGHELLSAVSKDNKLIITSSLCCIHFRSFVGKTIITVLCPSMNRNTKHTHTHLHAHTMHNNHNCVEQQTVFPLPGTPLKAALSGEGK